MAAPCVCASTPSSRGVSAMPERLDIAAEATAAPHVAARDRREGDGRLHGRRQRGEEQHAGPQRIGQQRRNGQAQAEREQREHRVRERQDRAVQAPVAHRGDQVLARQPHAVQEEQEHDRSRRDDAQRVGRRAARRKQRGEDDRRPAGRRGRDRRIAASALRLRGGALLRALVAVRGASACSATRSRRRTPSHCRCSGFGMCAPKASPTSDVPMSSRKPSASMTSDGLPWMKRARGSGGEHHHDDGDDDGDDHDRHVVGHAHGRDDAVHREHDVEDDDLPDGRREAGAFDLGLEQVRSRGGIHVVVDLLGRLPDQERAAGRPGLCLATTGPGRTG